MPVDSGVDNRTPLMVEEDGEGGAPKVMGIVERLVRDDSDRKRFLKMAGTAGAASFGAFVLAACGGSTSSGSPTAVAPATTATTASSGNTGDIGILNYALTLEYLETAFYKKVIEAKLFSGAAGALLKTFGSEEAQHVAALKAAVTSLGGTPVAQPESKFPITTAAATAELAYTVENLGAAAYLGQAGLIQSKQVLASALAIHTIEARHAASLGTLVKQSLTPDGAFAKPADMSEVLAAVKPFLA
jgi:hypothetical protein